MTKMIHIVLLLALSLVFRPMLSLAGQSVDSEKMSCCEKEAPSSKSCCEGSNANEAGEKEHSCDGDCDCPNCACVGHVSSTTLFIVPPFSTHITCVEKKHTFFFVDNFSSTFSNSLWLPPKIN